MASRHPILPLALLLSHCTAPAEDERSPILRSHTPSAVQVELTRPPPHSRARLVRILHVDSEEAVRAQVTLEDDDGHLVDASPPHEGLAFTAPIPGFRADRQYSVEVVIESVASGQALQTTIHQIRTRPLPTLFPDLSLTVDDDTHTGHVLFPANSRSGASYLVMVDRSGQPIWYLDDPAAWLDVEILEDGRIFGLADGRPTFTDWGDLQRETIHLDDHRPLHHDVALLPDDQGILGLTFENRLVSELPDNYVEACTSGSPGVILDNPVVWVDMAGNLLGYLPLVDRLDPGRIGFGALAPTATGGVDWAHANGIAPVPGEDAFLVSVRSQDAVIKVNGDGSLEWILANPYGWSPQYQALRLRPEDSGFRWFWHQHAPVPGPDGSLLIYDNGNYQANPCGPPPTEERQTRLVEIEIDEENWTFRERWSWQSGLFSSAMGNATWLEDGRLGVVMAMLFHDEEGVAHTDLGLGQRAARLLVLDPATGEVGWELRATSTNQVSEAGWTIPRADWLDSPWSPG